MKATSEQVENTKQNVACKHDIKKAEEQAEKIGRIFDKEAALNTIPGYCGE